MLNVHFTSSVGPHSWSQSIICEETFTIEKALRKLRRNLMDEISYVQQSSETLIDSNSVKVAAEKTHTTLLGVMISQKPVLYLLFLVYTKYALL